MSKKFLIKTIVSILTILLFVISTVAIVPRTTLADTESSAMELLDQGLKFQEENKLEEAEYSYQKAIDSMEASESIEDFLLAKSGLIETQFLLGKIDKDKANDMLQKMKIGYASLKGIKIPECGECSSSGQPGYKLKKNCQSCSL